MLCLRKANKIETMIVHSKHSRKQMKNTGRDQRVSLGSSVAMREQGILPGTAKTFTISAALLCEVSDEGRSDKRSDSGRGLLQN